MSWSVFFCLAVGSVWGEPGIESLSVNDITPVPGRETAAMPVGGAIITAKQQGKF